MTATFAESVRQANRLEGLLRERAERQVQLTLRVAVMTAAGFTQSEIGRALGASTGDVRVALDELRSVRSALTDEPHDPLGAAEKLAERIRRLHAAGEKRQRIEYLTGASACDVRDALAPRLAASAAAQRGGRALDFRTPVTRTGDHTTKKLPPGPGPHGVMANTPRLVPGVVP